MKVIEFLNESIDSLLKENRFDDFTVFHQAYIEKIKALDNEDLKLILPDDDPKLTTRRLENIQKKVVHSIREVINHYYNGHSGKALLELKKLLNNKGFKSLNDIYCNYLPSCDYKDTITTDFYRARPISSKETSTPKSIDLFHIPFEKRRAVSNQRFSISGFPCLYLGKSLSVCYDELKHSLSHNKNDIYACRFRLKRTINALDLTMPQYFTEDIYNVENSILRHEALCFILTYPIRHICLLSVNKEKGDNFTPEYIIPQLLLQLIRNDDIHFSGIMYSSTQVKSQQKQNSKNHNLALPVKEIKPKLIIDPLKTITKIPPLSDSVSATGHCEYLQNMFLSTEPVNITNLNNLDLHEKTLSTLDLKPL